jgi:hypothetical protein
MSGRISNRCSLNDLAMGSEPENRPVQRFTGRGQEAVEIGENRHTFLHSLTSVVWNGNEVKREISCRIKHFHEVPGWRNWQTQRTQNPPRFTPRGGSTPPPGTSPNPFRYRQLGRITAVSEGRWPSLVLTVFAISMARDRISSVSMGRPPMRCFNVWPSRNSMAINASPWESSIS